MIAKEVSGPVVDSYLESVTLWFSRLSLWIRTLAGNLFLLSQHNGVTYFGYATNKTNAMHAACECAIRHGKFLSAEEESEIVFLMPPPPEITPDMSPEEVYNLRCLTVIGEEANMNLVPGFQKLCPASR